MATPQTAAGQSKAVAHPKRISAGIITGHGFQHMYADGFLVLLPAIYDTFGLTPITASFLAAIRQGAGGLLTMGGGFIVDMFSGHRGLLLTGSLFAMGFGYALAAASPNYTVLLITLGLASAAGSFWHPVGLGILSQTYPHRRGLMMSLHRSAGNLGEVVTPLVVAGLMLIMTWRSVLVAGFVLIAAVAFVLYFFLASVGIQYVTNAVKREPRGFGEQLGAVGHLLRGRALPTLLLMSGLRGMADRSVVFFLPLFVAQRLRETDPAVSDASIVWWSGVYFVAMSIAAMVVPPFLGHLSDRVGRRPVMVGALMGSVVVLALLSIYNEDVGTYFSVFLLLITLLGAARFAVTNLTQAASLDLAEGMRLEGSMIGLLWGNNAAFGALAPMIVGVLVVLTSSGTDDFEVMFPYAVAMNLLALPVAMLLPTIRGPQKPEVATTT
ncbi:MAG: MFS transporter [Dehalococcoidia bacterium]